jgi:hypothetical protein
VVCLTGVDISRAFDESKRLNEDFPEVIAAAYAYMGDADAAFEWLQDVNPNVSNFGNRSDPIYATLHDDPRWAAWLATGQDDELEAISFAPRLPH